MAIIVTSDEELTELVRAAVREELERARGGDLVDAKGSGFGIITFRRLVRVGALQGTKVGRRLVVQRSELDRYLAQQRAKQSAAKPAATPTAEHDPLKAMLDAGRLRVVERK